MDQIMFTDCNYGMCTSTCYWNQKFEGTPNWVIPMCHAMLKMLCDQISSMSNPTNFLISSRICWKNASICVVQRNFYTTEPLWETVSVKPFYMSYKTITTVNRKLKIQNIVNLNAIMGYEHSCPRHLHGVSQPMISRPICYQTLLNI